MACGKIIHFHGKDRKTFSHSNNKNENIVKTFFGSILSLKSLFFFFLNLTKKLHAEYQLCKQISPQIQKAENKLLTNFLFKDQVNVL